MLVIGAGNHTYPMAGTIFEKSVTPLKLWFYAIYLMSATRCGMSVKQRQLKHLRYSSPNP